jgi:hypothetical protein
LEFAVVALYVTVNLDLTEQVTLRQLREFVAEADRIGADPDVDLREHDDNVDLVGLEAGERAGQSQKVPPAGFEPATHGLGNRCSIP